MDYPTGDYHVTQEQYGQVMATNPSDHIGLRHPVEMVSWGAALKFCHQISRRTGEMVRLPTEAQWEYVCRAGTNTPFNTGETIGTDQANYEGRINDGIGEMAFHPVPVGSFGPNAWGLYNMRGSVWEWCADWYDEGYANATRVGPQGPASCEYRVLRGGCFLCNARYCRSAARAKADPNELDMVVGFRVVMDLK